MFSLWQFCLEKDLVAGNKIFGGIEFSFSPKNLLFGKRFSWSWWNMRWHYFRYLPPFCSVSTRLCQIQNHSILHSGRQRELSQTGFSDIFIWFLWKIFLKLQRWQSQSWVLVLVIAIGWGGRRVRAWSYFSYFLSIDINCKRNNTNTRSSLTLSFIIEESFVSLL